MRGLDELWYDETLAARVARAFLSPASWMYGAAVWRRNRAYDFDRDRSAEADLPVLSVGNLTVGGTGKTPLAAWAAAELHARGAHPAIVLRGYGDDEPLVHRTLNPTVPVVTNADRLRGVVAARALGADCAILDDGFQHRRVRRLSDWVVVAAEQWRPRLRLLPAGPLREPTASLGRAHVAIVTRKSTSLEAAEQTAGELSARFPTLGVAVCHLSPSLLVHAVTGERRSIASLRGQRVIGVAAIGAPAPFFAQLRECGAVVIERAFRDHYAFSPADVRALMSAAAATDGVVCTLKDAVKLAGMWPRTGTPLWYVSQLAVFERGRSVLDRALEAVAAARPAVSSTAGLAGPSSTEHGHRSATADG